MNFALIAAFSLYLFILLFIGWLASRTQKNTSTDFIVGNRSVNYWVTAISAHAADMSDWLFLGFPAVIYLQGMFNVWVAIGLVLGMFASWQFVAPALRRATQKYHATTLPAFFQAKYHESSNRISIVSACIMAFFFTIYLAAGIKGVGYLLATSFGIPYLLGSIIAIIVTLIYTFMGGYVAAAWVDFFQGMFLMLVIVITPVLGYAKIGGWQSIAAAAQLKNISLSFMPNLTTFIAILLNPIAWGLGYLGMPHILSKFMGARDANEMHKSKYIGISWQIITLAGAALTGFVAIAMFPNLLNPEKQLFTSMTFSLFPDFMAGLILCGILAATLSTMNSQMLVLAGIVTNDLYKKYVPHARLSSLLLVFRGAIIASCVGALIIATRFEETTIFGLVKFAWSGLGASFGPATILALYNAPINRYGIIAGILGGGLSAIVWKLYNPLLFGYQVNEMLPGFITGLVVILLVSKIFKVRAKQ
jgi:SSS family solute:Na+ symporter